jgi:uncharacterized protein YozE (UPF0346 family)
MEKMALADIVVAEKITEYKIMMGLQHKVKAAKKHHEKGATKPIEVVKTEKGWTLVDGYARFCALTELGVTAYDVIKHEGDYQAALQEVIRKKKEWREQREAERTVLNAEIAALKAERIRQHELRMEQVKAQTPEEQQEARRKRKNIRSKQAKRRKKQTIRAVAMQESFFWCWMNKNHPYRKGKTNKTEPTAGYIFVCRVLSHFMPETNELETYFKYIERSARESMRTAVIGVFLELWEQYYEEVQAKSA